MVNRSSFQGQAISPTGYLPIPERAFVIENSYTVMVGVKSTKAKQRCYLGCWAEQRLLFAPSSTTEYVAAVKTKTYRCELGALTLCTFPKFQPTWILNIRFPWWLEQASIEVWRYDGRDQTIFEAIAQTNP